LRSFLSIPRWPILRPANVASSAVQMRGLQSHRRIAGIVLVPGTRIANHIPVSLEMLLVKRVWLAFGIVLITAVVACQNGTTPGVVNALQGQQDAISIQFAGNFPPPSTLHSASFATMDLVRFGQDFDPLLPHNKVTKFVDHASFLPQYSVPGGTFNKVAYALYHFKVTDFSFDPTVHFSFSMARDYSNAWVALADFTRDRWDWMRIPATGVVTFDPARHFSTGWDMYVIPLFTGLEYWDLAAIRVGTITPPQINSISPLSGETGKSVKLVADVSGTAPFDYHWTFTGFGLPVESVAESPSVTLSSPGQHLFSLRVTNSAGTAGGGIYTFTVLPPDPSWQHSMGGAMDDIPHDVAADGNGDVYVVGDSASFGSNGSAVILKYSMTGALTWVKKWDGPFTDTFHAVAIDADGNIIAVGGTDSYGAGHDDLLIVKYAPDGTLLSQQTWGGSGHDTATGIAVDQDGNIYITGWCTSFSAYGNYGVLLEKYDAALAFQWAWVWGSDQHDYAEDVAVDSTGNVYVTGLSLTYGGNGIVLKSDPSGTLTAQVTWDYLYPGNKHFYHLAVDAWDNIFVIGDLPDGDIGNDPVILKYDTALHLAWARQWPGWNDDSGRGIAVDSNGIIYATGATLSHGESIGPDMFLLALDATGNLQSAFTWGIAAGDTSGAMKYQQGQAVAILPGDDPVVASVCENMHAVWQNAYTSLLEVYGTEGNVIGSLVDNSGISGITGTATGAVDALITGYTVDTGYNTKDIGVIRRAQ
jgi:hypothetical protein